MITLVPPILKLSTELRWEIFEALWIVSQSHTLFSLISYAKLTLFTLVASAHAFSLVCCELHQVFTRESTSLTFPYFGLAQNSFISMPSKKLSEELGSEMLSDEWEVWTLKSLLKFSNTIVNSMRWRAGQYE
jgi:hypothetical protein